MRDFDELKAWGRYFLCPARRRPQWVGSGLALLFGLAWSPDARGTLLFYEPFSASTYANDTLIGTGPVGQWSLGNSPGNGSSVVTNSPGLTYSGLVTSNSSFGLLRPANSTTSNRQAGANLSSVQTLSAVNPTVYCSFLLNVQATPSANRCLAALSSSTSSTPNIGAGAWLDGSSRLLVSKNSTTPAVSTSAALGAGTHLVIVRYKYNSGSSSDDEVALWLDPDPATLGAAETGVPGSNVWTTANSDLSSIAAVYAVQAQGTGGSGTVYGSGSGVVWMDEIRVGTTWADVTPRSAAVAPPPVPVVTQVSIASDGVILSGTNGLANGTYAVLASTNLGASQSQWPAIATNGFDGGGNFTCTNPLAPGAAWQFYRLLVKGIPPAITAQPQSETVFAGQTATFFVAASSTLPLSYQWFFDTNTLLAGVTNAVLTLGNVQTNEQGTYSATVMNAAGSMTSTAAVLTVMPPNGCVTPPSGLVGWWPGEGNVNDIVGTNNGTLAGNASANANGKVGLAFSFDGTNGYAQVPDSPVLRPANLTIEAWVRFNSLDSAGTANAGHEYLVFKRNNNSTEWDAFSLGKDRYPNVTNRNGDVLYFIVAPSKGAYAEVDSQILVATNVWYHVAGVRGPNYIQLYVNGQLQGQANVSFPQDYAAAHPLYFGTTGEPAFDGRLKGVLDEVSLYNRALASNEIAAIYLAGAAGKCK